MSETSEDGPRRAFFRACIGGMTVGAVATVTYPVIAFLGFPKRLSTEKPLEIPLGELAPGQAQYASLRGKQIIVLAGESGPVVLSAACTHLGCSVVWESADRVFRCPCHGALFDAEGGVVSGPVNEPLKTVPFTIDGETLIVS